MMGTILDDIDRAIMEARARELARPLDDLGDEAASREPFLEFRILGGARYAVQLSIVEEITRIGDIFPIPLVPRHIQGIIRRRGASIALVSLKHYFYPRAEGLADADFAVVVRAGGKRFAVQAEEIEGVSHINRGDIAEVPENFDARQRPHVGGVTADGLVMLNMESFVAEPDFAAGRGAGGGAAGAGGE